jgi:hypothetical protein
MRELIARKEGLNEETEIMRLLKSLTFDETHMKVNRKMTKDPVEDKKSKSHWFSSSSKSSNVQRVEPKYVYGQSQPAGGKLLGVVIRANNSISIV